MSPAWERVGGDLYCKLGSDLPFEGAVLMTGENPEKAPDTWPNLALRSRKHDLGPILGSTRELGIMIQYLVSGVQETWPHI